MQRRLFTLLSISVCAIALMPFRGQGHEASPSISRMADVIREEAVRSNKSPQGRPLPLASLWPTGVRPDGFDPDYQLELMQKGHYLLPVFQQPPAANSATSNLPPRYYDEALRKLAAHRLPLSFISTQWESLLTTDPLFSSLPKTRNPNVIDLSGTIHRKVSPFGEAAIWQTAGERWTATQALERLQKLYADPPRIFFVSNNEHPKLTWNDLRSDARYAASGIDTQDPEAAKKLLVESWKERYQRLFSGMRMGLRNETWRKNSRFIGYSAFGPPFMGRFDGWEKYALNVGGVIDPYPGIWDGGSSPFYVRNYDGSTDYTVWSPQIEAMNLVPMLEDAFRANPEFWFEISTWDGYRKGAKGDRPELYRQRGQVYGPSRYAGMVQFGMWLLRPRAVREYRDSIEKRDDVGPYFVAVMRAVDRVHTNPMLKAFWRDSRIVPNNSGRHPYQVRIPPAYERRRRWFLLEADLNPPRPWNLVTELRVFALARVRGSVPRREWLVYAHAPRGEEKRAEVEVPGYGLIEVSVPVAGAFYRVREKDRTVQRVH